MAARVNAEKCTGCGACVDVCPVDGIRLVNEVAVIDENKCTECGLCADECPENAISLPG